MIFGFLALVFVFGWDGGVCRAQARARLAQASKAGENPGPHGVTNFFTNYDFGHYQASDFLPEYPSLQQYSGEGGTARALAAKEQDLLRNVTAVEMFQVPDTLQSCCGVLQQMWWALAAGYGPRLGCRPGQAGPTTVLEAGDQSPMGICSGTRELCQTEAHAIAAEETERQGEGEEEWRTGAGGASRQRQGSRQPCSGPCSAFPRCFAGDACQARSTSCGQSETCGTHRAYGGPASIGCAGTDLGVGEDAHTAGDASAPGSDAARRRTVRCQKHASGCVLASGRQKGFGCHKILASPLYAGVVCIFGGHFGALGQASRGASSDPCWVGRQGTASCGLLAQGQSGLGQTHCRYHPGQGVGRDRRGRSNGRGFYRDRDLQARGQRGGASAHGEASSCNQRPADASSGAGRGGQKGGIANSQAQATRSRDRSYKRRNQSQGQAASRGDEAAPWLGPGTSRKGLPCGPADHASDATGVHGRFASDSDSCVGASVGVFCRLGAAAMNLSVREDSTFVSTYMASFLAVQLHFEVGLDCLEIPQHTFIIDPRISDEPMLEDIVVDVVSSQALSSPFQVPDERMVKLSVEPDAGELLVTAETTICPLCSKSEKLCTGAVHSSGRLSDSCFHRHPHALPFAVTFCDGPKPISNLRATRVRALTSCLILHPEYKLGSTSSLAQGLHCGHPFTKGIDVSTTGVVPQAGPHPLPVTARKEARRPTDIAHFRAAHVRFVPVDFDHTQLTWPPESLPTVWRSSLMRLAPEGSLFLSQVAGRVFACAVGIGCSMRLWLMQLLARARPYVQCS